MNCKKQNTRFYSIENDLFVVWTQHCHVGDNCISFSDCSDHKWLPFRVFQSLYVRLSNTLHGWYKKGSILWGSHHPCALLQRQLYGSRIPQWPVYSGKGLPSLLHLLWVAQFYLLISNISNGRYKILEVTFLQYFPFHKLFIIHLQCDFELANTFWLFSESLH